MSYLILKHRSKFAVGFQQFEFGPITLNCDGIGTELDAKILAAKLNRKMEDDFPVYKSPIERQIIMDFYVED